MDCVFFFFKQKTAYEIGTGDWSSDVCSSDLVSNYHNRYVVMKFVKGCSLLSIAIFRPNDKQMKMQQSNYTTWNLFKKRF